MSSPTPTPTPPPTPEPTPTPQPTPTPDEGLVDATDAPALALEVAFEDPLLTEIETGADSLSSSSFPGGLSDPFGSDQGGWSTAAVAVDPLTSLVAAASGVLSAFVGANVDVYTAEAPAGNNPNEFTTGQNVDPFSGAQNAQSFASSTDASQVSAQNAALPDPGGVNGPTDLWTAFQNAENSWAPNSGQNPLDLSQAIASGSVRPTINDKISDLVNNEVNRATEFGPPYDPNPYDPNLYAGELHIENSGQLPAPTRSQTPTPPTAQSTSPTPTSSSNFGPTMSDFQGPSDPNVLTTDPFAKPDVDLMLLLNNAPNYSTGFTSPLTDPSVQFPSSPAAGTFEVSLINGITGAAVDLLRMIIAPQTSGSPPENQPPELLTFFNRLKSALRVDYPYEPGPGPFALEPNGNLVSDGPQKGLEWMWGALFNVGLGAGVGELAEISEAAEIAEASELEAPPGNDLLAPGRLRSFLNDESGAVPLTAAARRFQVAQRELAELTEYIVPASDDETAALQQAYDETIALGDTESAAGRRAHELLAAKGPGEGIDFGISADGKLEYSGALIELKTHWGGPMEQLHFMEARLQLLRAAEQARALNPGVDIGMYQYHLFFDPSTRTAVRLVF
jgi:hypothetical protein